MSAPDPEPWLRLVHAPGVGPALARALLARFGDAARACSASRGALIDAGLTPEAADSLRQAETPAGVARDREWAATDGRHLLTLEDPRYPARLAAIADPPPVLYLQGDPEVLAYPMLAIVGTRHPTAAGRENAHEFARHLAASGLVIASGLAVGIDGAAHEGALAGGGLTVAAAGTGLDRVYPARHADLARRIAAEGALVSELPIGTRPSRSAFPRRNRILAGLCAGTLVIEAAVRSGSLITARMATEQDREVFAIPGSIHNPVARGCHQLIRQGAKLVETADDVLEELAPLIGERPAAVPDTESADAGLPDDPDYARLFECLDWEPRAVDELAARSGLAVADLASMLLRLELEGHVHAVPGGLYQRV
ncbi:MAG: DNA-processing protein DprA [Halofilum sp. (in: g-proteobacteria)]